MSLQSEFQRGQDPIPLFAHRGEVATKTAKRLCSLLAAKATGDLLLRFDHANIALRQIIVKRNGSYALCVENSSNANQGSALSGLLRLLTEKPALL